jgi:GNAT superfamily N-acetyltransferase
MIMVRRLQSEEFAAAVEVISRGMRDNPLHIQALGPNAEVRLEGLKRMFSVVLPRLERKGLLLGAFKDAELVGVTGMVSPRKCRPTTFEWLIMLPRLLSIEVRPLNRVGQWMREWKKHDLDEAHWHLGPVAVDAHLQRTGIGSAMMARYCAQLDQAHGVGYLETDKAVNVGFYEKFGFKTIAESNVLDIPNWFMRRPAQP